MSEQSRANVDPAEIAKFDSLASRWWDPEGEFRPLHDMNPVRLDWIRERVGDLDGRRMLDVGCGGGILTEGLAREGAEVTGIDMAEAPLSVARLHLLESKLQVDYRQVSVEDLASEAPGSFDTVTCLEMLEHVPDPASVIAACRTLVKPGGDVIFSTINRNPKAFLLGIVGAEYIARLLPRGTHEYARFIRPSELEEWARNAGLQVQGMTGMLYNPLTRKFRLGRDTDVNYLMHFRREI
ncbi:MAG: bifunctional 2-polyprenyl-6-hydroxyphenol methylase/3-demethylubiquinol 3-O-methyltransferase UbiG [Gammaproteobacteria bacterium]|nr:bifunctional 2-polyprenyl-6-hydroxyphenol methylase/3-demethylubiquinol 3-O-methyltransferase UbiG [Gammaproteobacteria bacterium]